MDLRMCFALLYPRLAAFGRGDAECGTMDLSKVSHAPIAKMSWIGNFFDSSGAIRMRRADRGYELNSAIVGR